MPIRTALTAGCPLGIWVPDSKDAQHWVDAYRVVLRDRGTLRVRASTKAFDAYLRIYRADSAWKVADREPVAENNDTDEKDEHGESELDAAIRRLVDKGRYLVFVSGWGAPGPYTLTATFDGDQTCHKTRLELNHSREVTFSDTDCTVSEILRRGSNTNYGQQFLVETRQRGSLEIQAGSARWKLYDAGYQEVSPGRCFEPGTYLILAESPKVARHELSARFTEPNCRVEEVGADAKTEGALGPDCRVCDVEGGEDGSYLKQYRVYTRRTGALTIRTDRGDIELIPVNCDLERLAGGWHEFRLRSPQAGSYTLTTRFQASCPATPLKPDTEAPRTLATSDCQARDVWPGGAEDYLHRYDVAVERRGILHITVTSSAFEPYVFFHGKPLPPDSKLMVEPGVHPLEAAARGGRVGAYTLGLLFACPEAKLDLYVPASGEFAPGDCRVRDFVPALADQSYAHQYRVTAGRHPLRLDSNAGLMILNSDRVRVDGITASGAYYVLATAREPGRYTVTATPECAEESLKPGQPVSEELSDSDCREEGGSYRRIYGLTLTEPHTATISLGSGSFAPRLTLSGPQGRMAEDAGNPGTREARIARILEAGRFSVSVGSAGIGTGQYTLATHLCPLRELTLEAEHKGRLATSDCRTGPRGALMQQYRLTLEQPGTLVVSLHSDHFDPRVMLADSQLRSLEEHDTWIAPRTTGFTKPLGSGQYVISVTTRGLSLGEYTLRARLK